MALERVDVVGCFLVRAFVARQRPEGYLVPVPVDPEEGRRAGRVRVRSSVHESDGALDVRRRRLVLELGRGGLVLFAQAVSPEARRASDA